MIPVTILELKMRSRFRIYSSRNLIFVTI